MSTVTGIGVLEVAILVTVVAFGAGLLIEVWKSLNSYRDGVASRRGMGEER